MLYSLFIQMFIKIYFYVDIFTPLGDFELQYASIQGIWQEVYSRNNVHRFK